MIWGIVIMLLGCALVVGPRTYYLLAVAPQSRHQKCLTSIEKLEAWHEKYPSGVDLAEGNAEHDAVVEEAIASVGLAQYNYTPLYPNKLALDAAQRRAYERNIQREKVRQSRLALQQMVTANKLTVGPRSENPWDDVVAAWAEQSDI